jgi:hypothetical protein
LPLKYYQLNVTDSIVLDLDRMYRRFGALDNYKIFVINQVIRKFNEIEVQCEDLGNVYNRAANITENTADIYDDADLYDRIFNGYITDNNGIITGEETFGTQIIT